MNYLSRDNVDQVLGLSPLQRSLLTRAEAAPGPTQVLYRLEGPLDPAALRQAWDDLVRAHDALRVVFRRTGNRTVQVVLRERPVPLAVEDLRGLTPGERQACIEAGAERARSPFDPATGPLLRAALFRLTDRAAALLWTHHELILDDSGRALLLADVLAAHDARVHGRAAAVAPRRPFREYLAWLTEQDWEPAQTFWADHLAGFEEPTPPLLDRRPSGTEPGVRRVSRAIAIPADRWRAIAALAGRNNTAPRAVAAAAWAVLLRAYSGRSDVLFHLACDGRPPGLDGAAEIIGRLASAVPFRVPVQAGRRLPELLRDIEVRQRRAAACAHVSPEDIGRLVPGALEDGSGDSRLVWREPPPPGPAAHGGESLRATGAELLAGGTEPLVVDITPTPTGPNPAASGATVALRWFPGVLEPDTADRILGHWETILAGMVADPGVKLCQLPILPPAERHRVLVEFNQAPAPRPGERPAHRFIEDQTARRPEALAATFGEEYITYSQLNGRANRMAHWLRSRGFGRDSLAALFAGRGSDMLVAILAALKAGGGYVPLDPFHPDARLRTVLETSRVAIILTETALAERSRGLADGLDGAPPVFCLDGIATCECAVPPETEPPAGTVGRAVLRSFPTDNPEPLGGPHDLANVFFTSGSTGVPKGAMVEHVGMVNHLWAKIDLLGLTEDSVVAQNASHCFDISVWQFLAPLMVGGRVVIYDNETAGDPQALLDRVRRDGVTVLELVPTMLDLVLQAAVELPPQRRALPRLAHLVSTGEALPVALCRRWLELYPRAAVVNAYGATECSDDTTHEVITAPPPPEQAWMSVGRPIPGFRIHILDARLCPVPIGCRGEIYFAGIGVGRGYLDDPQKTAEAFVPDPLGETPGGRLYRTGDAGYYLPDGRIVFAGRLDHQVKVRGHRIELGEIEAALLRYPGIGQAVAIVRADSQGQDRILAYVTPAAGIDPGGVRQALAQWLPRYMLPDHITPLAALPLNRNGKVDRKALPEPDGGRHGETAAPPRDELERELAAIWQEVLEVADVGIDDNFFDLGGNSLRTVQVRARAVKRLGIDLGLGELFANQTIRELAPVVRRLQEGRGGVAAIPRLPAADHYPTSHAQRRLWFLHQLEPRNCSYNMAAAYELQGPWDIAELQRALRTIVDRHAGLRTTFDEVADGPAQRVAPHLELSLPVHDLSALDETEREVERRIGEEVRTGFDLEAGPLIRGQVLRLAADRHLLVLSMHHIVSDAWSWAVLEQELVTLYGAYSRGEPDPLPPLPVQYPDYAQWQNRRLESGDLDADERFWLELLGGELPVLDLPTDRPRPPLQTYEGSSRVVRLEPGLAARLGQLARREGVTRFMLLLAATGAFLSRLSGAADIVVGTPVANRNQVELEGLIGFFVNTLPLRLDLGGDPRFLELLRRVKRLSLDAFAHQEYPFDQLVERLNPVRDLSRPPLFNVMFQAHEVDPEPALEGRVLRRRGVPGYAANFDLTIVFATRGDRLRCRLEYNTALFDAATMDRWLDQMQALLAGIVADPECRLSVLPLSAEREGRRPATAEGDTARDTARDLPPMTLHGLFEDQVARTPAAPAICFQGQELSYEELNRRADRLARTLRRLGVGADVPVGVHMERSLELVVGLLAVLKAGGAYLPLDPAYPADRLAYMAAESRAPVILTQPGLRAGLPPRAAEVVSLEAGWGSNEDPQSEGPAPGGGAGPSNLAYIMYTSGSTGRPKGVMISHDGLCRRLAWAQREHGLTAADRLVLKTPLSFDVSVRELFWPLTVGARVVIARPGGHQDPRCLAGIIRSHRATVMHFVPSMLRLFLEDESSRGCDSLRLVVSGGEELSADLVAMFYRSFADAPPELYNMYGPTEGTIEALYWPCRPMPGRTRVPVGRPVDDTMVHILDGRLVSVPPGVVGELYIGGAGVARGYLGHPGLTAERFVPDPFCRAPGGRLYRTGDLGRLLPGGDIEFRGRADDQVKLRGVRIEPGEIEAALRELQAVREAVVLAHDGPGGDRRLVAYVVPSAVAREVTAEADLHHALADRLPDYMIPSRFVTLDALPLLANGKVDRRALPAPDDSRQGSAGTYLPPRDALELGMVQLWEEVLGVRPIGVHDDFFRLGGHSLRAVVLMSAVQRRFGVELPLVALFQERTVAGLCGRIQGRTTAAAGPLITIRQGDDAAPPLFLVHPQGGGVLCYFHLARELGAEHTVHGLQAVGYDTDEEPLDTIEAMADRYVAAIRPAAALGPICLAGWSFGGTVAVEMARRLEADGHRVGFLGLIDAHPPGSLAEPGDENGLPRPLEVAARWLGLEAGGDDEAGWTDLLRRARELDLLPAGATVETIRRKARVMVAGLAAAAAYRCRAAVQTDICLFRAGETAAGGLPLADPDAWRRYTAGRVHLVSLPGTHHSLLRPPHVAALAGALREAMIGR